MTLIRHRRPSCPSSLVLVLLLSSDARSVGSTTLLDPIRNQRGQGVRARHPPMEEGCISCLELRRLEIQQIVNLMLTFFLNCL